jgi:hypothetical protein
MIATIQTSDRTLSPYDDFLEILPRIHLQAKRAFACLGVEAKEELVDEVIASAFCVYKRLVDQGKDHVAHPTTLAANAIRHVRSGRCVGTRLNKADISSRYAQRLCGIVMHSVDSPSYRDGAWREILVEDPNAGPAETAAARIDVSDWLAQLGRRRSRIAEMLARGETTADVARQLDLSPGRISQLRQELKRSWISFQGDSDNAYALA